MCGIIGIINHYSDKKDRNFAAQELFKGLIWLNNRGQNGTGILTYDTKHGDEDSGMHRVKYLMENNRSVSSCYTKENLDTLIGSVGIGHVRYSTCGAGEEKDIQPLFTNTPGFIAIAHNGNIVNYLSLKKYLKEELGRPVFSNSDTEIILSIFADKYAKSGFTNIEKICRSVEEVHSKISGSYSVVMLIADEGLVAFRDPYGNRPLLFGTKKDPRTNGKASSYAFASETCALTSNGYDSLEDVTPGEVIFIDHNLNLYRKKIEEKTHKHCVFEYVYFAEADSKLDGVSVYHARSNLGKVLASKIKERNIIADLVIPVPDTGRIAAIALARELNLPLEEGLLRNKYSYRTFIMSHQDDRERGVNSKLKPVREILEDKKVIVVDDSIVRGTTSNRIVNLIREEGKAKEIIFVSTFPEIIHPCCYGIDFQTKKELVTNDRDEEMIRAVIGADKLVYNDLGRLRAAVGLEDICVACVDGKYHTNVGESMQLENLRNIHLNIKQPDKD